MQTRSIVLNPRALGLSGFLREAARARRVGPGPETVFRLFRPFHGPELDAIYRRVMEDGTGRRILLEGRSLRGQRHDMCAGGGESRHESLLHQIQTWARDTKQIGIDLDDLLDPINVGQTSRHILRRRPQSGEIPRLRFANQQPVQRSFEDELALTQDAHRVTDLLHISEDVTRKDNSGVAAEPCD